MTLTENPVAIKVGSLRVTVHESSMRPLNKGARDAFGQIFGSESPRTPKKSSRKILQNK